MINSGDYIELITHCGVGQRPGPWKLRVFSVGKKQDGRLR